MIDAARNAMRLPDLRNKILFTFFIHKPDPPRPSVILVLRQCFDSTG